MSTFIEIIGWMSAVITAFYSLPQTITLLKTKNAQQVSYPSFFVLLLGIIFWTLYGAVDFVKFPHLLAANSISAIIAVLNVSLILKYSNKKSLFLLFSTICGSLVGIVIIFSTVLTILAETGYKNIYIANNGVLIMFACLAVFSTALAFAPQNLKTLKSKNVDGLSLPFVIAGLSLNVGWLLYWGLKLSQGLIGIDPAVVYIFVSGQIIAVLFYLSLFILIMMYGKKKKAK